MSNSFSRAPSQVSNENCENINYLDDIATFDHAKRISLVVTLVRESAADAHRGHGFGLKHKFLRNLGNPRVGAPPECHRSPVKAYNVRSNAVVHGAQDLRALGSRLITMMFLVRVARPSKCFSQDPKMGCASYTHTKAIRCFSVRVARPSRGFSQDPKMSSAACSRLSGRHSTMTKETPALENSRFPV